MQASSLQSKNIKFLSSNISNFPQFCDYIYFLNNRAIGTKCVCYRIEMHAVTVLGLTLIVIAYY